MKKMEGSEETIYGILLDVQKQIGELSRQTGEQTQKLVSIENKVNYTNGTVIDHGKRIIAMEKKQENWTGRIAILSIAGGVLVTLFIAFIKNKLGI